MFRKTWLIDTILITAFLLFFICFILRVKGAFDVTTYSSKDIAAQLKDEEFEISLMRLNTLEKLTSYCDSIYYLDPARKPYAGVVSDVLRKRFYHTFSYYSVNNNPLAVLVASVSNEGFAAIVIPEDIVRYPYAACSQQSIIGMEILKRKGYLTRKVVMFDQVVNDGHFAYEVNYDGGWHFFDTDQEPDTAILNKYDRPSVAFLSHHPDIVAAAYHKRDTRLFESFITSFKTGVINKFPAPKAYIFQVTTKYLTHLGWVFVWVLIMIRNWKRRNTGAPVFSFIRVAKKRFDRSELAHA